MNLITCISLNHCIGKQGKLATRIPEDLNRFKQLTTNQIVVMGSNTFFGDLKGKPLEDRINIVLSSKTNSINYPWYDYLPTRIYFVKSAFELKIVLSNINSDKSKEVFIIGGAAIYKQFIDLVDIMYITHSPSIVKDGDTFFNVDWSKWDVEEIEFAEECTYAKYVRKP